VYSVRRPYPINVLCKRLVADALIFQEQDNNVSACATTALWMAFRMTSFQFQTALPPLPHHDGLSQPVLPLGTHLFQHRAGPVADWESNSGRRPDG
jgi:hypothetical protein